MEYPLCRQSVGEKKFLLQLVQAISYFFIQNFKNFANCKFLRILKTGLFHRVKELSNSIELSMDFHLCNHSVKQKQFFVQLAQPKFGLSYGNLRISLCERILNIVIFDWIKKLSKLNQTWNGVSSVQVECRRKRIFAIACLGNKLFFHKEF